MSSEDVDPEDVQMTLDFSKPSGVGGPAGKLEEEAAEKVKWVLSLGALRNQIRRTDVELRHLTGDKDLKEFETNLLRILTVSREVQEVTSVLSIFATVGFGNPLALIYGGAMLGMIGVTSGSVMMEVS